MRVIIAGGRDFNDKRKLNSALVDFILNNYSITEIVTGGAKGADSLGKEYAELSGIPHKEFLAKWELHGLSAGPIRNKEMALYGNALIAFWDGKSKGTKNMIDLAKKHNLLVSVVKY